MLTSDRFTRKRLAIGLTAVALAAGATVAAAAATRPGGPAWTPKQVTQYLPDSNHSQYDAVIVVPGEAWFFGGSNVAGAGVPEVLQRKNGHWPTPPPLPSGLTSWITAASATSADNIWAVTRLGGSVLFWDGAQWTQSHNGGWDTNAQFTGITAVGPSDVWLFGSLGTGHPGAGTWHLTPAGWKRVLGTAAGLSQAGAAGPNDLWAIGGAHGLMKELAHFDGATWTRVKPGALSGFNYSYVLVLAPGNVWVAGSIAGHPRLGHFDGHRWTSHSMPGSMAATGMCRDGRGGLWVIANSGTSPSVVLRRSAAGSWTRAQVSSNPVNEVLACASVPGRQAAWGAGKAAPQLGASGTAAAAYGTGAVP